MSGTSWPSLSAGAKAKASEVELKFDWLEGDLEPMSGGTKTNAAYDIGTSSFKWRNAYLSGQLLSGNGSVSLPSISFATATDHGLYYRSASMWSAAVDGTHIANFSHHAAGGKIAIGGDVTPNVGLEVKQLTDDFLGGIGIRRSASADIWAMYMDTGNSFHLGLALNATAGDAHADFTDYFTIDGTTKKLTVTLADDMIATAMIQSSIAIETLDITTALSWKTFNQLKILQIVQYTTASVTDVTSATYTATNLSGAITPKINGSKILVFAAGNLSLTGVGIGYATVFRGSTDLASTSGGFALNASQNNHSNICIYDSPATTSSTTYEVRIRHNTGAGGTVSYPGTDGGSYTPTAVLILIEVAQ